MHFGEKIVHDTFVAYDRDVEEELPRILYRA